jgi:glycine oxidase
VQTTSSGIAQLCLTAQKLVPALSMRPIQQAWAGLLPVTPDTRPILGPVPFWENVTLACGYNGYGLLLSASTGDMIAEQIVTGHVSQYISPFLLERFTMLARHKTPGGVP